MSAANNGGPAFPVHGGFYESDDPRNRILGGGITTRDYFVGKALVAIFTQAAVMRNDAPPVELAAKVAYRYADAMLLERAK